MLERIEKLLLSIDFSALGQIYAHHKGDVWGGFNGVQFVSQFRNSVKSLARASVYL